MPENTIDWERSIEYRKFSVRCKVEYAFRVRKCQFGYMKPGIAGCVKTKQIVCYGSVYEALCADDGRAKYTLKYTIFVLPLFLPYFSLQLTTCDLQNKYYKNVDKM